MTIPRVAGGSLVRDGTFHWTWTYFPGSVGGTKGPSERERRKALVIARMWRTEIDARRRDDYADFEQKYSLQMFRQQAGFLGVLFLRMDGKAAALSFWESLEHVERLAQSSSYMETVARLERSGLLRGDQSIEVFAVEGGRIDFVV